MFSWAMAVAAGFTFGTELMKLLRENGNCPKDIAKAMKGFRDAMRKARLEGDFSEIENKFKSFNLRKPGG